MKNQTKMVSKLLEGLHKSGEKGVAWLVDPDKIEDGDELLSEFSWIKSSSLDLILVGGSHISKDNFSEVIRKLQLFFEDIPIVIFPGSQMQLSAEADAILFLSLLSGRNPEYLIGHQVTAAPLVQKIGLEVLPTGYVLVNDGEMASVHYVSQTFPLPNAKPELVEATVLAGKFLGMKFFFLDAGSGVKSPVSTEVIQRVKKAVNLPLIVGGGLDTLDKCKMAFRGGADLLVIGNAIEKDPSFLAGVLAYKEAKNLSLHVN